MSDSLEDFVGAKKKDNELSVNGSMRCQTCNEIVHSGTMNEDDMIIHYSCTQGHNSRVKL
jgi:lysyl-tRNA synthetase class I